MSTVPFAYTYDCEMLDPSPAPAASPSAGESITSALAVAELVNDVLTLVVAVAAVWVAAASWGVARQSHRLSESLAADARQEKAEARRRRVAEIVRAWARKRWGGDAPDNRFTPIGSDERMYSDQEADYAQVAHDIRTSGVEGSQRLLDAVSALHTRKNPPLRTAGQDFWYRNMVTLADSVALRWLSDPNADLVPYVTQAIEDAGADAWHRGGRDSPNDQNAPDVPRSE